MCKVHKVFVLNLSNVDAEPKGSSLSARDANPLSQLFGTTMLAPLLYFLSLVCVSLVVYASTVPCSKPLLDVLLYPLTPTQHAPNPQSDLENKPINTPSAES